MVINSSGLTKPEVAIPKLQKMCEFVLALPGTNASVERVFSLVNNFFGSEKSIDDCGLCLGNVHYSHENMLTIAYKCMRKLRK